ncbi:MAG: DUF1801 domain-containing protein [Chloroflexi bacterium]|nr:DUF1801 domain-containing protein [Chloroflexota bacterium]
MPSRSQPEPVPVEALLEGYAPPLREIAQRLRRVVMRAAPDAVERVRPGWRLIGYDLPVRRHGVFFAWVWPELEHVHLGFPNGVLMDDPGRVMKGAGVTKKARWLTYRAGAVIGEELAAGLVEEAARVAMIPRSILG